MRNKGLSVKDIKNLVRRTSQMADFNKGVFNEVKGGLAVFAEDLNSLISHIINDVSPEKQEDMYEAISQFLTDFYMSSDYGPME